MELLGCELSGKLAVFYAKTAFKKKEKTQKHLYMRSATNL
jgi:hypothetical protein